MKILALACLFVGLILGPAYWVIGKFFTGSRQALIELKAQAPEGPWRSPDFRLESDMSPAGLILHVEVKVPTASAEGATLSNHLQATLTRGEEKALPLGISQKVSSSYGPIHTFREHLLYVSDVAPGIYRLDVSAQRPPELPVNAMRLEVRQHLHEPNPQVVTAGMFMLMLGILVLVAL